MVSLEQITYRLNSGLQLTTAEQSLCMREILRQLQELKDAIDALKQVPTPKSRVDSHIEGPLPTTAVRRKHDL